MLADFKKHCYWSGPIILSKIGFPIPKICLSFTSDTIYPFVWSKSYKEKILEREKINLIKVFKRTWGRNALQSTLLSTSWFCSNSCSDVAIFSLGKVFFKIFKLHSDWKACPFIIGLYLYYSDWVWIVIHHCTTPTWLISTQFNVKFLQYIKHLSKHRSTPSPGLCFESHS